MVWVSLPMRTGEVGGDGLADDGGDAGADEVLEAGGGDVEGVGAGVEVGEEVFAGGGAGDLLMDVGGGLGEDDLGVGDGGAGGVGDAAGEGGGAGLGGEEGGRRGRGPRRGCEAGRKSARRWTSGVSAERSGNFQKYTVFLCGFAWIELDRDCASVNRLSRIPKSILGETVD